MANKRLDQLIYMFSDITGKTPDESKKIILLTDTGKAVNTHNMTVMYEQETANLYSIGMELRKISEYSQLGQLFSTENIIASMNKLRAKEVPVKESITTFTAPSMTDLKSIERIRILEEQTRKMQIKRQNLKNVWRMKNADNS